MGHYAISVPTSAALCAIPNPEQEMTIKDSGRGGFHPGSTPLLELGFSNWVHLSCGRGWESRTRVRAVVLVG